MKYYFSVAAIFKNESWNLKEWILHYKHHGADHIYLVNDFSDDDYMSVLQPFIDEGYVTLFQNTVTKRYTGRQVDLNNKYFRPICNETQWIAQVDLDEFLYSPKCVDLKEILPSMRTMVLLKQTGFGLILVTIFTTLRVVLFKTSLAEQHTKTKCG